MSDLAKLYQASAHHLPMIADKSVQLVVTSPPYFGLRKYDGDQDVEWGEVSYSPMAGLPPITVPAMTCPLGNEPAIESYIAHLILCAREWRRCLADDGVCFVNLGDSYNAGRNGGHAGGKGSFQQVDERYVQKSGANIEGIKPKSLLMVPARFALAMQADGWILRSEVIWCLSGGTLLYVRTQKGIYPMTVKDVARLDPKTVQLWNGEKWTQLLGTSKSPRKGDEVEIVLRSGERISCTLTHKFPTNRGLLDASELQVGDKLQSCRLPEPEIPRVPDYIGQDAAWLAGLYVAEGSRSGDTIQIAGHTKETERWERLQRIALAYGGTATKSVDGNNMNIRLYGKVLNSLIDYLVTGSDAKTKGFSPVVWQFSNVFLDALLAGYLAGDGHWDESNNRWRLGFARNYNLERDLRTLCARLGYKLVLNMTNTVYQDGTVPTFRGEIRFSRSGHHNEKDTNEIMEIRKARCREVYDLGVEDEPHLFALASGILTHNSKPNPMPESVTDRPTKAHEMIYMFSKQERYFYDAAAVAEPLQSTSVARMKRGVGNHKRANGVPGQSVHTMDAPRPHDKDRETPDLRNLRTVWNIATQNYNGAHFACFPPALVEPMIKAGTSAKGCCPTCGKCWKRVAEREPGFQAKRQYEQGLNGRRTGAATDSDYRGVGVTRSQTVGWEQGCKCPEHDPVPCVVLDPFSGSGTTLRVAIKLGRIAIGTDLSEKYLTELAPERMTVQQEMNL